MYNVAHSFLIGLSSFIQETRTAIKSLDGLEIGQDWTRVCGSKLPLNDWKIPLGLYEHSSAFISGRIVSFLQVTRTVVKVWRSLNFSQILSPTIELAAPLSVYKINVLCCEHSSTFIFDWLVFFLACIEDSHTI